MGISDRQKPREPDRIVFKRFQDLERSETLTTKDGRELRMRKERGDDGYRIFERKRQVFYMSPVQIRNGWFEVRDIGPVTSDWESFIGQGIGRFLYDSLERDVQQAGGKGIRPSFGNLSTFGIEFWKKRIRVAFPVVTDRFLEELFDIPLPRSPKDERYETRIKKSRQMWEGLQKTKDKK